MSQSDWYVDVFGLYLFWDWCSGVYSRSIYPRVFMPNSHRLEDGGKVENMAYGLVNLCVIQFD